MRPNSQQIGSKPKTIPRSEKSAEQPGPADPCTSWDPGGLREAWISRNIAWPVPSFPWLLQAYQPSTAHPLRSLLSSQDAIPFS